MMVKTRERFKFRPVKSRISAFIDRLNAQCSLQAYEYEIT